MTRVALGLVFLRELVGLFGDLLVGHARPEQVHRLLDELVSSLVNVHLIGRGVAVAAEVGPGYAEEVAHRPGHVDVEADKFPGPHEPAGRVLEPRVHVAPGCQQLAVGVFTAVLEIRPRKYRPKLVLSNAGLYGPAGVVDGYVGDGCGLAH